MKDDDTQGPFPPPGSCDCHVHVIGPKPRFPLASPRSYTPADAPVAALETMMAALGLTRAVVVQPSVYGTDNRCTLDALARLGPRGRGVAVIDDGLGRAEREALHRQGVRGVRMNLLSSGGGTRDAVVHRARRLSADCAETGWHLQVYADAGTLETMAAELLALPVPVVLDHFGMVDPTDPAGAGAATMLRLLDSGRIWIKASGFYRPAQDPFDPALGRLAARLSAENPERIVWGSDWPHTPQHGGTPGADRWEAETPFRTIDTARLLGILPEWLDADTLHRVLVANPATLYDFPDLPA